MKRSAPQPIEDLIYFPTGAYSATAPFKKYVFLSEREHTQFFIGSNSSSKKERGMKPVGTVTTISLEFKEEFDELLTTNLNYEEVVLTLKQFISRNTEPVIIKPRNKKKQLLTKLNKLNKIKSDLEKFLEIKNLKEQGYFLKYILKSIHMSYSRYYYISFHFSDLQKIIYQENLSSSKIRNSHVQFLENYMKESDKPVFSLKQFKELLQSQFPNDFNNVALSTVKKIISLANIKRKKKSIVLEKRNTNDIKQARKELASKIACILKNGKKIIYIDESGFDNFTVQQYGYALKGTPVKIITGPKLQNTTLILAISNNEVIGFQCVRKGVKGRDFGSFLAESINNRREIKEDLNNYYFFCDNASCHKAQIIKSFLAQLNIIYNTAYSPMLTPIEEVFALVKRSFCRYEVKTYDDVVYSICKNVSELSSTQINDCWQHTLQCFLDALENKSL